MTVHDRNSAAMLAEAEFRVWLHSDGFTCLGARASERKGLLEVVVLSNLLDVHAPAEVLSSARNFIASLTPVNNFASLVMIFPQTAHLNESEFETSLWHLLSEVAAIDGSDWAPGSSSDPSAPNFSFSVGMHPFFIVGMHPASSRPSRRAPFAAIALNSHEQFARLKTDGTYAALQTRIRDREMRQHGSINPMLADFGSVSEARQYSGRAVADDWRCPFHVQPEAEVEAEGE